jgi:small-conductance mechanosensitive channel
VCLSIAFGKEFNAAGAVSQELQRKLLYLAASGSGSVLSGHTTMKGLTTAAGDKADAENFNDLVNMMQMATARQERIDALNDRLNKLEEKSYEALMQTERELRIAREELQAIRDNAYQITFPDGTVRGVYRDGDKVRTEDGAEVDREIVRVENIPANLTDWSTRRAASRSVLGQEQRLDRIKNLREKLDDIRDRTNNNPSSDDLDELDDLVDQFPASALDTSKEPDQDRARSFNDVAENMPQNVTPGILQSRPDPNPAP